MNNIVAKVKICGVTSPKVASMAVKMGVTYIGLIFHPSSIRNVNLNIAKDITRATLDQGGVPVAVFVNQSATEMVDICEYTDISVAQLHSHLAIQESLYLPFSIKRIIVKSIGEMREVVSDSDSDLQNLHYLHDFVLFDSLTPGCGQSFNFKNFSYTGAHYFGIAGGLTKDNVNSVIQTLHPHFVDVSSGVESKPGQKDLQKIELFMSAIKSGELM